MPNYIIAYHGGEKLESQEKGAKQMEKWKAWVGGIGDAIVNPGNSFGNVQNCHLKWRLRR